MQLPSVPMHGDLSDESPSDAHVRRLSPSQAVEFGTQLRHCLVTASHKPLPQACSAVSLAPSELHCCRVPSAAQFFVSGTQRVAVQAPAAALHGASGVHVSPGTYCPVASHASSLSPVHFAVPGLHEAHAP
jgi:hypothetical protein